MSDEAQAARARDQIKRKGRLITLNKTVQDYDPQTGGLVKDTALSWAITIPAVATQYSANQINGTTVQRGDKQFLIASDDLEGKQINNEVKVLDGIETWNVQDTDEIRPGNVSMIWKLQVRR